MKQILIIYPHWAPSNLAGVHRARLIGNFLPDFGWHPIVITVAEEFYEEIPDKDIHRTFRNHFEVYKTKARKIGSFRLIGDIGLRGFNFLKKKALDIIAQQRIDFIWIPIPSFYMAILGRQLHEKTGLPYGIDYIDPWVRDISNRRNWRSVLSLWAAKLLEPYAVGKASLISGVSEAYYMPVIERNGNLKDVRHVAMPYGFDPGDHEIEITDIDLPWKDIESCKAWVYAGAFLPNSGLFMEKMFGAIAKLRAENNWDGSIRLFFVGTGNYGHKSILEYAEDANIGDIVREDRCRKPFLHILNFLSRADGVMIIGSTEQHYTASKTFQSILSKRPVFAMMHSKSSAAQIMQECNANNFLVNYDENTNTEAWTDLRDKLLLFSQDKTSWKPDFSKLEPYSARQSALKLVEKLNDIVG